MEIRQAPHLLFKRHDEPDLPCFGKFIPFRPTRNATPGGVVQGFCGGVFVDRKYGREPYPWTYHL